jgi:hypothetical protein
MQTPPLRDPLSHETLPACLLRENPNRLVSLWDILNAFDCFHFVLLLTELQDRETMIDHLAAGGTEQDMAALAAPAGMPIPERFRALLAEMRGIEETASAPGLKLAERAEAFCNSVGFRNAAATARLAIWTLKSKPHPLKVAAELKHIRAAMTIECGDTFFVRIASDRKSYFEQEHLFGPEVDIAFPGAASDIRDAGDCLAVENNTAAVFHLMRVVEHGLRALAWDREIEVAKGPLDLAT